MDLRFLMSFGIGLGIYLFGLGIFCLIKYLRNKRKFTKEKEDREEDEEDANSND